MRKFIFMLLSLSALIHKANALKMISMKESVDLMMAKIRNLHENRVVLFKRPQSLAILMNFDNDGKSSVYLMDSDTIFWSDTGYCSHGRMYDPAIGLCRDIFCIEGYYLSSSGCEPDINQTIAQANNKYVEVPEEIDIEFTINYGFSDQSNITLNHSTLLEENDAFLKDFKQRLATSLSINSKRIKSISIILSEFETVHLPDNNNCEETESCGVFYHSEKLNCRVTIGNKTYAKDDIESVQVYFNFFALAFNKKILLVNHNKRQVTVSNVLQIKNNFNYGWCEGPGTSKIYKMNELDSFRILARFSSLNSPKDYFIYVNSTGVLYSKGIFDLYLNKSSSNQLTLFFLIARGLFSVNHVFEHRTEQQFEISHSKPGY
jgi:hypothetical protein